MFCTVSHYYAVDNTINETLNLSYLSLCANYRTENVKEISLDEYIIWILRSHWE